MTGSSTKNVRRRALWRLERARLVRTRRWLALAAAFIVFGFANPIATRYMSTLIGADTNNGNIHITVGRPTPADAISSYTGSAMQLGLLIVVIVAAAAFSLQGTPALATFYRTRVRSGWPLLAPRWAVTSIATVVTYLSGLLVAYYETTVLIAPPNLPNLLAGAALNEEYLLFAISVTALSSTIAKGTLGTAAYSLIAILTISILGAIPHLTTWLPSTLSAAPKALLHQTSITHYLPAAAVTAALTTACLLVAATRFTKREL